MKVPALRRGNAFELEYLEEVVFASMKVPALRRGNLRLARTTMRQVITASMKVPALRRGNAKTATP